MLTCTTCKQSKAESGFHRKGSGYRGQCKDCVRAYRRQWYADNRESSLAYAKRSTDAIANRNQAFVLEYLQEHPCIDCGYSDPRALEFDHIRGVKKADVSKMAGTSFSLKKIQDEIAKCEVVCANCHRIRTGDRGGWFRSLAQSASE